MSSRRWLLIAAQVIPQLQGDANQQAPPDLPSYLFKERIVYLVSARPPPPAQRTPPRPRARVTLQGLMPRPRAQGMSLVPAVTELILAELMYLQYDNNQKPIYMYINSTGTTKVSPECPTRPAPSIAWPSWHPAPVHALRGAVRG